MKKTFLIPALAAFTLASCGGVNQNQNGGTATDNGRDDVHIVSTTATAYQIFKLIDPKNASIKLGSGTDTTAKDRFSYSVTSEDGDGAEGETVNCLSHSDGGLLVVSQHWYYGDMDGYNADDLKLYRYQDGKLSERNDLLPQASISDFAAIDAVSLYNAPDDDNLYSEYDTEDAPKMLLYHKWMYNDPVRLFYKWDGAKFIPAESDHQTKQFNILSTAGIGRIFLGDNPPESLDGFQKNAVGKTVYFNRDGKKQFKLSLNDEGKIDTITILSDRYTYRMDADGPTNDHYGIGFNDVGYGLFKGQYFVMKDGVWVRTIEEAHDYNHIDMFGENSSNSVDYPHNGVIEFYTTKNAITNIYPEIGKKVDEFDDNPKYDENATVTLIKIYRQQPAKIAEEVFRKMFPEIKEVSCYNDTPLKCYGSNPEEDEGCESGELLACYPLKNGGYIVTVAHDFSGPGCASEYQFYTKKYIDGKISNSADLFPTPQLDDLLNPAKTAGHESDIAEFRKMYDKSPIFPNTLGTVKNS